MTLTVPSVWERQDLSEATPGGVIATGKRQDLRGLNRNILRNFSANAASNLAILSIQKGLYSPNLSTSYATVGLGNLRVWGNGTRVRVHVYGDQVRVRVSLGGVVLNTASQTAIGDAWASSTAQDLAGATIDADGFLELIVDAQLTAASGRCRNLKFVILEELPTTSANMPGPGNSETDFRSMHDELYATGDDPVDVEQLQTLDDRVAQCREARGPRQQHLYPRLGDVMRLASAYWRLDGPYTVQVPDYCDKLDVSLTLEVTQGDFKVLALTEYENLEDVLDNTSRQQTINSGDGVVRPKFLGLKARPGQPCLVWIAFKSDLYSEIESAIVVGGHSMQKPESIQCERVSGMTSLAWPMPWGLCLIGEAEDVVAGSDPTVKNGLGYSTPRQIFDVGCAQGVDPGGAGGEPTEALYILSPHPGTGITTAPSLSPVERTPGGGALLYEPTLELWDMAIGYLYGVYVQATVDAVTRKRRARAAKSVSAGLASLVQSRVNQLSVNGTPWGSIRHFGQRVLKPDATPTGGTIHFESSYLHVEGRTGSGNLIVYQVPLCDPNAGVSTGIYTRKLYARVVLACVGVDNAGSGAEEEGQVSFGFTGEDVVVETFRLRHRPNYGRIQSPTEADLITSAWATHVVPDPTPPGALSPFVYYANAYTQTVTWPQEGTHERGIWDMSPVFEIPIGELGGFPGLANIEITPIGSSRYGAAIQVVVADVFVWWGPRT